MPNLFKSTQDILESYSHEKAINKILKIIKIIGRIQRTSLIVHPKL